MAILKDLIVHGSSRFLNKIYASEIQTPLIEADAGIIKKLKADDVTVVGLLDVKGQLHTNSWTNSNIATIDGSFYITPTIESAQGTVGNISTSTLNFARKSGGDDFATVSSLYLGDGTSITWPRYSKILITGQILLNGEWIPLGTLLGQLNAAATAASIKVYNITDNKNRDSSILATLANSGITSTTYRNLKISLYQRANGASSFYPLGIYMTATGTNGRTFLDIYGGVEALSTNNNYGGFAEPNVRIGNLQGLPNVGGQTPSGWGIYTDNGYFKGIIAADRGYIGTGSKYWVIANYEDGSNPNNSRSYIYNNTDSMSSTVEGIYLGTDGIRNYKDSTHFVTIQNGVINAKGVNLTGQINATAGNIGGASITGGTLTVPAAYISGELTAATINGSKITANSITAGQIAASAITADELAANAVTSTKIKAGEVKADNIAANAVTAGKISVDNLSAITANLGTITTGVIKHDTVGGTNGIWLSADTDTSSNVTVGNSTARKDWRLLVNNKFGVTKTGDLYASSANISGTITATDGTIGGINIVNGALDVSSISIGSLNGANNYAQKTDVTQAIDNIEIGGRNLILQSSMERESPKSVNNSAYASPIPNISDYGISLLNNTTDYFTYSFDYEVIGNTAENAYVYAQIKGSSISNGNPYTTKNIINEPVGKYCATFKLTDSQINSTTKTAGIRLRNATDNAILIVKNMKLEKGNKATDWTPAPEDIQESINNAAMTATSYITYIDANDGIKIHNAQDTLNYLQLNSTAISMFRDRGDGINNDEVLRIDDTGIRIGKNEGPHFSLANDKIMGYGNKNDIYFEVGTNEGIIIQQFYGDGIRTSFQIGPYVLDGSIEYVKKNSNILTENTDYTIDKASTVYDIIFKIKPDLNTPITIRYKSIYYTQTYSIGSSSTSDVIVQTVTSPSGTGTQVTIKSNNNYQINRIQILRSYNGESYWVSTKEYTRNLESDYYIYQFQTNTLVSGDTVRLQYLISENSGATSDTIVTTHSWDSFDEKNNYLSISETIQILQVSINNNVLVLNKDYKIEGPLSFCYLVFPSEQIPALRDKIEIKFKTRGYNSFYHSTYFNFSNKNEKDSVQGMNAASFGSMNINKGAFCLVEGVGNTAVGYATHVEGANNIASGSHAHAGGVDSFALGQNTFVHGSNLQATYLNSAAFGYYNSPDNQLFSIGKGGSKNAFSVNKDGNIQLGGQLLAGTTYTEKKPLFAERNIIWTVASIGANSAWTKSISIDYSGYRPIGICGFGVYNRTGGANADWCVFPKLYIWHDQPDMMDVYVWNQNTNAAASNVAVYVKILYMATSVVSFDWSNVTYTG